ncbi:uncharacterized protein LOC107041426 [Diachasma alloeum]|uniref:uncharacterized protein LOC107041426 n=1 Tax=Diachasma alloeum TaxID=454923 RepID=UPI0007382C22|nr:uncharacterized protein LOC107041426 [Diachasma alloeum]
MACLRVVAVLLVAVLYVTIVDGAAVRTDIFEKSLQAIAQETEDERLRIERAATTLAPGAINQTICGNQPCGWAVYTPFIRQLQTYISNTCTCSDRTFKCIRTDDDLSVNAYVYHCRQNATDDAIEAPENAD